MNNLINQSQLSIHEKIVYVYSYPERLIIATFIFITIVLFLRQIKKLWKEHKQEINKNVTYNKSRNL